MRWQNKVMATGCSMWFVSWIGTNIYFGVHSPWPWAAILGGFAFTVFLAIHTAFSNLFEFSWEAGE